MEQLNYSTKRLNFLYDFCSIVLKTKKRFCIESLGADLLERRNNVLFLYKFILKDILKITDINRAKEIEKKLGLDYYGKQYIFLYTDSNLINGTVTEENVFYPVMSGFVLQVIYNNWDIDRNIIEEYEWLKENLSKHNTEKKLEVIDRNLKAFSCIKAKLN